MIGAISVHLLFYSTATEPSNRRSFVSTEHKTTTLLRWCLVVLSKHENWRWWLLSSKGLSLHMYKLSGGVRYQYVWFILAQQSEFSTKSLILSPNTFRVLKNFIYSKPNEFYVTNNIHSILSLEPWKCNNCASLGDKPSEEERLLLSKSNKAMSRKIWTTPPQNWMFMFYYRDNYNLTAAEPLCGCARFSW